ncbi:MAG: hypothetical protein ACI9HK_004318 [Pirellulaceae bacterium]|jgi:hypothetical protein
MTSAAPLVAILNRWRCSHREVNIPTEDEHQGPPINDGEFVLVTVEESGAVIVQRLT